MSVLTYTPHTAHSCNQLTLSVPRAFPTLLCFLITLLLFSFLLQLSSSILSARKLWMFSCFSHYPVVTCVSRRHSLTGTFCIFVKLISNHDKPVSESNVAVERRTLRLLHQLLVWESVEEVVRSGRRRRRWYEHCLSSSRGFVSCPLPSSRTAPQLKSNDWMPDIPGQSVQ